MNHDIEQATEQFLQEIGREFYLNGAGLKEDLNIIPIYDKYSWIFQRATVDEALKNREDKEGRYLATFAVEGYLSERTKELDEKITNAITKTTVEWDGEQVPYRKASVLIANDPDSTRRHELQNLIYEKNEELNPEQLERMEFLHAQAKDLGFANYRDMCEDLKALNLDYLQEQMQKLLVATEDLYESELEYYLGTIGVQREDAWPADTSHLQRAPMFDKHFSKEKLIPALKATLAGMGIDLDSQTNMHLDTENRPLKSPRAFCSPVIVPDEVYLVISPIGGQDDFKAMMHEAGHLEHLGSIDPSLPFAFKRLGDGALSEAYAFLLENLIKNRLWLENVLGEKDVDDYLRFARFGKMWILRRYAAKLEYELKLHTSSDVSSMRQVYADTLGKALKVNISPKNYLFDVDDGFYSAGYIRAWIFEVLLRRHLEKEFGLMWFTNPEAGKFLMGMWKNGQKYSVDELAKQIGHETLDPTPLIQELIS